MPFLLISISTTCRIDSSLLPSRTYSSRLSIEQWHDYRFPFFSTLTMPHCSTRALAQLTDLKLPMKRSIVALTQPHNSFRKYSTSRFSPPPQLLSSPSSSLRQPPNLRNPLSLTQLRTLSDKPLPKRTLLFRTVYRTFAFVGGFGLTLTGCVLAFFIYDASTYREDLTFSDITVPDLALHPRRGGAKNLPILEITLDEDDSEEMRKQKGKPRLLILGSGWGSVAMLKTLNPGDWNVTVLSEVEYFLFTPMLPSATLGTLELRSLLEPMRRIVQRVRGHFLKGSAFTVDFTERLVEVSQKDANGVERRFYLPYDKLVIGVGMDRLVQRIRKVFQLTGYRLYFESSWRQGPREC